MLKVLAVAAALTCATQMNNTSINTDTAKTETKVIGKSIYDFKVEGLEGGTIDFSKYKGKKILVVNTASKCGFTPQYEGLEKLYESHKDNLVIVGFPANK